jgi:glycosyltransferase involved in cell wall biosynthesis
LFDNTQIKSAKDVVLSGIGSLYNIKSAAIIEKAIRRFKPDVIHVHNFFPLVSPSVFFVAARNHVPIVMSIHNFRLICPSTILYHNGEIYEKSIHKLFPLDAIAKGVYRNSKLQTASTVFMTAFHKLAGTWKNKVDKYITMTEFAKNMFLNSSLNVPADKWVIKPNFTPDPGVGREDREEFFLFMGRLTKEKGIETILEATKVFNFTLKIIGDGPLRELVETYAARNPNIIYAGFQQKPYITEELKKCKALLFPSVWYEGFPMTILESFAAGTPVISSKLGAMVEMIDDKSNGLHVKPGDVNDLVEKIKWLSQDATFAKNLGRQARRDYEEKYSPENNYKQMLQIYQQVIAAKKQVQHT